MTHCELCEKKIDNQLSRSIVDGILLDEKYKKIGRVFPADLLGIIIDREIAICRPCGHALINQYTGIDWEDD